MWESCGTERDEEWKRGSPVLTVWGGVLREHGACPQESRAGKPRARDARWDPLGPWEEREPTRSEGQYHGREG